MIPRVLISSLSSSAGKTTVVSALCSMLGARGKKCAAIKVGPDFIDGQFHAAVQGVQTGNIDLYFTDEEAMRKIFQRDTAGADVALIEGAMGFFDGVGGSSPQASAFHVARVLGARVLLVIDAKKKSLSVAAEILGVLELSKKLSGVNIDFCVFLNKCSEALFLRLAPKIEELCGVGVVGYLEENADFAIESRHLGLVTPDAVPALAEKIARISGCMEKSVDIEKIIPTVGSLPEQGKNEPLFAWEKKRGVVKIAVARDAAFSFYYRENLALLESFGAELCFFSPLKNEPVPAGACALYIGGGYPELFWNELSENSRSASSLRSACRGGLPVFAECGGFLYLQMLGILAGTFENKRRLVRFGYAEFQCAEDTFLLKEGEKIRGHEFHYFDTTENGRAFRAKKPGGAEWMCIQCASAVESVKKSCCKKKSAAFDKNIVAGFPHFYFPSNPKIAENFVDAALAYDALSRWDRGNGCAGCSGCGGCGSCSP